MFSLESDWLSCSDLVGNFDVAGVEVFFTALEKIKTVFGISLRSFRMTCSLGIRYFFLDLDDFCFHFEYWALPWEYLLVYSAVAASDFGAGALIFVLSLNAAPRTRRYCFTALFHCVYISKTWLAVLYTFIIFVNSSCCLFSRELDESLWLFFFESK